MADERAEELHRETRSDLADIFSPTGFALYLLVIFAAVLLDLVTHGYSSTVLFLSVFISIGMIFGLVFWTWAIRRFVKGKYRAVAFVSVAIATYLMLALQMVRYIWKV